MLSVDSINRPNSDNEKMRKVLIEIYNLLQTNDNYFTDDIIKIIKEVSDILSINI